VTPRIVQPLDKKPALPTDTFTQPSPTELFFKGQLEGSKPEPSVDSMTQSAPTGSNSK
jgi:Flp pilus assembly secretin CpaC